ncbi:MAG: hypothetical protein EXQ97_08415 [Alphaproteobacteria bacterium]|nr:hypothetical protein [Alphaproteobacteria bacterium]
MEDYWLVRPRAGRILWGVFAAILAATVLAELLIERHAHFGIDGIFAFNAWYGFGGCIVLIVFSKALGAMLKRTDTFYDG